MLNNEKNNKKDDREVCQGLLYGRCSFGWNGRGCSYFHPKPCRVYYNTNRVMCEDKECRTLKHHPAVCHTVAKGWVCYDQTCLAYHKKWDEHLIPPQIPPSGGWDGLEWRKPSKKKMKEWAQENHRTGGNSRGGPLGSNQHPGAPQDKNSGPIKKEGKQGKGGDDRNRKGSRDPPDSRNQDSYPSPRDGGEGYYERQDNHEKNGSQGKGGGLRGGRGGRGGGGGGGGGEQRHLRLPL